MVFLSESGTIWKKSRGISPVVGVILLIVLVIGLATLATFFVFDITSDDTESHNFATIELRQNGSQTVTAEILEKGEAERIRLIVNGTVRKDITNFSSGDLITLSNLSDNDRVILVVNEQVYESLTVVTTVPPNATILSVSPEPSKTGDSVQFNSTASDLDGNIVSYEWSFGDGSTATGQNVSHTYSDDGTYTVRLTVEDNDGETASNTTTVQVRNRPPSVSIDSVSPNPATVGETVSFNSTGSDPDGSIVSYEWNFDDGSTATGRNVTHSFGSSGTYNVSVTVTDDDGDTATDSVTVTVQQPPNANFSYTPENPTAGETVDFTAKNSSDPDGNIVSYEWDFGDGSTATGENVTHSFSSAGSYNVTLTVTDDDGASDSVTKTVEVFVTSSGAFVMKVDSTRGATPNGQFKVITGGSNTFIVEGDVQGGSKTCSSTCTVNVTNNGINTIRIRANDLHIRYDGALLASDESKALESIEQWGNINWESFESSFKGARYLTSNAPDDPDLADVESTRAMFFNAESFNSSINSWDTSNVRDMGLMMGGTISFNKPLDNWDTSNVTTMEAMFKGSSFNRSINSWDTSEVTNMRRMFENANSFNKPLDNWDTSNVEDMSFMFRGAKKFNQPINSWDTSNVTTMEDMFYGTDSFNQSIDSWETGNVTNMATMFSFADAFNQPLNSWDTSSVTTMQGMFDSAISFNKSLDSWETSNVTNMDRMFHDAQEFDKDISSWCVEQISSEPSQFDNGSAFEGDTSKQPNWGDPC